MGKDLKGKELGEGICQRKDGRYTARFSSRGGGRKEKIFKTPIEAKKWLIDAKYQDSHGQIAASTQMTVNTWYCYWIENIIAPNTRRQTKQWYDGRYKNRIQPTIGNMPLSEVRAIHCQKVMNYANSEGDVTETIKKLKSFMSSLFSSAVENELITSNPVTRRVKYAKKEQPERRVLSIQEQKLFSELAKGSTHYDEFMFVLETGVRVGELSGLKWSDIDWKAHTITITETLYHDPEIKDFVANPPKTLAGRRTIKLTEKAYHILLGRKRQKSSSGTIPMKWYNYVFINSNGNPVDNRTYNKCLKLVMKKVGITGKFSMHCLRHTFATRCIETGMKPKTLQYILGHSKLSMTMDLYVHTTSDDVAEEMRQFEAASVKWA